MPIRRHTRIHVPALFALGLAVALVIVAGGEVGAGSPELHCMVEIEPVRDGASASRVGPVRCYDDEAAVGQMLDVFAPGYPILKLWDHTSFGGSSLLWYSTSSCDGRYVVPDLAPYGWDDRAGSAHSPCGRTIELWDGPDPVRGELRGARPDLDLLDNRVSFWHTGD